MKWRNSIYKKVKYFYVPHSNPLQVLKQTTEKMLADNTNNDQYQKSLNKQVKTIRGTKNEKNE